ncbi:MAG: hypothetical protein KatS3mg105_4983 [Gemmatales bacterium]|nr:MAG: hypothetical protein KatS3mg105_4983 [Gemmatales bacterium]
MSELVAFAKRIEGLLTAARREPHWTPEESERYMKAIAARREKFESLARRLIEAVIQPRLETLASYFPMPAFRERSLLGGAHAGSAIANDSPPVRTSYSQ